MPSSEKDCYFSLFQLNDRFMDEMNLDEDYAYAEMQFIVTKMVKIPPKTGRNNSEVITGECAYVDGVVSDLYNNVSLKVDNMTAGKYLCFYTANFKPD